VQDELTKEKRNSDALRQQIRDLTGRENLLRAKVKELEKHNTRLTEKIATDKATINELLGKAVLSDEDYKKFPQVVEHYGGTAMRTILIKAWITARRRGADNEEPSIITSVDLRGWKNMLSFPETVIAPDAAFVLAPHFREKFPGRCAIAGCQNKIRCNGVSTIKILFTLGGPKFLICTHYSCYTSVAGEKNAPHNWQCDDKNFATVNNFVPALSGLFVSQSFAFDAPLLEMLYNSVTLHKMSISGFRNAMKSAYARLY
jgi:hypothetical protein